MATKQKKRSDGRLQRSFTLNGKRHYVYGYSKRELDKNEQLKRQEIAEGIERRKNPKVQEYIESWLDNRMLHVKESTYRGQRQVLNIITQIYIQSAGKTFGEIRLPDVTVDDVKLIQKELLTSRRTQTVNDYMALLKHVFKDAVKERRIDFCPVDAVVTLRRTEKRARDGIHRALTIQEQKAFFDCKRTKESNYYNVYRLAINTGMRFGEIGALSYSDIRGGMIHVTKTITRTDTGAYRVGDTPKTDAGNRTIPITEKIAEIIEDQKEINSILYGNVIGMDDLIFRAPQGGLLMATPASREIKRICKLTGIEDFTMHAFRATFATRCIEQGMNPRTIQELLGHSNYNITMSLYGHCLPDTMTEEMNRISIVC